MPYEVLGPAGYFKQLMPADLGMSGVDVTAATGTVTSNAFPIAGISRWLLSIISSGTGSSANGHQVFLEIYSAEGIQIDDIQCLAAGFSLAAGRHIIGFGSYWTSGFSSLGTVGTRLAQAAMGVTMKLRFVRGGVAGSGTLTASFRMLMQSG